MRVHLVDGTYELFRAYYGPPGGRDASGREVGATRGLLRTLRSLLKDPEVTHVGVAFDTVVESFRNELFPGYKTGEGMDPDLWGQFPLAERAAAALGLVVWPMVEFEADDALATAADRWGEADGVEQVVICTPDKDLAQCVRAKRVVLWDRRRDVVLDENGVVEKYGVPQGSIPDWLALVGDAADGFPGIPRWGARSSSVVLTRYPRLEEIPEDPDLWDVKVRGRQALSDNLREAWEDALLYRELATLRTDVPLTEALEDLRWRGPTPDLAPFCEELGIAGFAFPAEQS